MALDTLEIFGDEFTNVTGIKATDSTNQTKTYIRPQGTKSISANGTGIDVTAYASVDVSVTQQFTATITTSGAASGQAKAYVAYNSTNYYTAGDTITYSEGDSLTCYADSPMGACKVYVDDVEVASSWPVTYTYSLPPSDITINLSAGSYVKIYTGGSAIIQSLTVSPSTSQQTFNSSSVDGYKPVTVNAMPTGTAGTPTATKGTVSNHSVSVTPSVTNTTGYITGSTKTGTAVTVSASELVSGSETKTANGTYDVTNLAELVVSVSSGSSKNVQVLQSTSRTNASSLTKVLGDLTVSKTGTYDVYWSGGRSNTSTSYTWGTRLYVDGSGYGTENTTWTNNCQSNHLSNVSLSANQKLSVYARGRTGSYYTFAPMLVIIEA